MFLEIIDGADIGMIYRRRGASLSHESRFVRACADELFRQKFERHGPLQFGIERLVDDPHAALADFFEDFILLDCCTDHKLTINILYHTNLKIFASALRQDDSDIIKSIVFAN